jgi:hypothetical protein
MVSPMNGGCVNATDNTYSATGIANHRIREAGRIEEGAGTGAVMCMALLQLYSPSVGENPLNPLFTSGQEHVRPRIKVIG